MGLLGATRSTPFHGTPGPLVFFASPGPRRGLRAGGVSGEGADAAGGLAGATSGAGAAADWRGLERRKPKTAEPEAGEEEVQKDLQKG